MLKCEIRKTEERLVGLFAERRQFSEHLIKWEDRLLPDKYDHNYFEYSGQPTKEEFAEAVTYQKNNGDRFIKLEGHEQLSDPFGLELNVLLTMALTKGNVNWVTNPDLLFTTPSIEDLEELEVKHFGKLYGEDFTRRNIRRLYGKLTYHGAFLDGKLIGSCYSFCKDGFICIDGLIVDESFRKRYAATSLIAQIRQSYPEAVLFLHADEDDTPKKMYEKMGFEAIDRLYEYMCLW